MPSTSSAACSTPAPARSRRWSSVEAARSNRSPWSCRPCPGWSPDAASQIWKAIGLKTRPVATKYVASVSPKLRGGLYVEAVSPGSPAARADIQAGDILVGMNVGTRHWETIRPDNILYILRQSEAARTPSLQYYLVRREALRQGAITVADGQVANVMSR